MQAPINQSKKEDSMTAKTAKEAAGFVNQNPETSSERVKKVIPEYQLALHKNQWIATFFKHLAPDLHLKFQDMRPPKRERKAA